MPPPDEGEIVIVGDDGTEHVFPSGFDPKKAAAIVRGSAPRAAIPAMELGRREPGGFTVSDFVSPPPKPALNTALEGSAHPQTAGDFLSLLIPSELTALGGAKVASTLRGPVGKATQAVGRTMEAVGTTPAASHLSGIGAVGEMLRGNYGEAIGATVIPAALQYMGKGMKSLGELISGTEPLTLKEISALKLKLIDPKLANNPIARKAVETAILSRGGKL